MAGLGAVQQATLTIALGWCVVSASNGSAKGLSMAYLRRTVELVVYPPPRRGVHSALGPRILRNCSRSLVFQDFSTYGLRMPAAWRQAELGTPVPFCCTLPARQGLRACLSAAWSRFPSVAECSESGRIQPNAFCPNRTLFDLVTRRAR